MDTEYTVLVGGEGYKVTRDEYIASTAKLGTPCWGKRGSKSLWFHGTLHSRFFYDGIVAAIQPIDPEVENPPIINIHPSLGDRFTLENPYE